MTINFKVADGKNGADRVFGLLAGKAGVGKTTQLTTFPNEETLGISVERGFLSIEGSGARYVEIETYDDILSLLDSIKKKEKKFSWIKTLFIDSLSEIYDLISKEAKDKFTAKQNFAKFDEIKEKLLHIIRVAKTIDGINVFFTCHTQEKTVGLIKEEDLAFDGSMPERLKRQFDLIVHMQDKEADDGNTYKAFVTSSVLSPAAKIRKSPWLDIKVNDVEEPNLYKLTNKLLGKGA